MLDKLKEINKHSYSPYSNFSVSAIVVMKDGKEFPGVNVENASYGATICAERSAILSAISNGYTKHDFDSLHIYVNQDKPSTPCFMCRQVITEMFEKDKDVICYSNGGIDTYKVSELCTYPFDESDLN